METNFSSGAGITRPHGNMVGIDKTGG